MIVVILVTHNTHGLGGEVLELGCGTGLGSLAAALGPAPGRNRASL